MARQKHSADNEPVIVNRRARHDYQIEETFEVGVALRGSEVKSVRAGKVSLTEGYVRAEASPLALHLHGVHIAEYPPAGANQHNPTRVRQLLAHRKEISHMTGLAAQKGVTIVPLKMYFRNGRAKLQIGVGRGKRKSDKRQDIKEREAQRDIERAMSRRR